MNTSQNNLKDHLKEIVTYLDGQKKVYKKGSEKFLSLYEVFKRFKHTSHPMPALGVSLDAETKSALNCGVWLEFVYEDEITAFSMPFSRLLVKVVKEYISCDIIRYTADKGYWGRCFHLSSSANMKDVYDEIVK